jgi:hypothetical protein
MKISNYFHRLGNTDCKDSLTLPRTTDDPVEERLVRLSRIALETSSSREASESSLTDLTPRLDRTDAKLSLYFSSDRRTRVCLGLSEEEEDETTRRSLR